MSRPRCRRRERGRAARLAGLRFVGFGSRICRARWRGRGSGTVRTGRGCLRLAVAAIGMQQRVRICLRVSDQVTSVRVRPPSAVPPPLARLGPCVAARSVSAAAIVVTRSLAYATLRSLHRHGRLTEVTLIVGAGDMGALITNRIMEHPEFGLRPVGLLDGCPPLNEPPLPILGSTADLVSAIERDRAETCDRELPGRTGPGHRPSLECMPGTGRRCLRGVTPSRARFDDPTRGTRRDLGDRVDTPQGACPAAAVQARKAPLRRGRGLDLLCVLSPVLVVLAVLVRLRWGKPALFRQLRDIGEGRTASILKLRTLPEHDDSDTTWSVPMAGCTGLGRWLRSTHIDELTQLVNVIRRHVPRRPASRAPALCPEVQHRDPAL